MARGEKTVERIVTKRAYYDNRLVEQGQTVAVPADLRATWLGDSAVEVRAANAKAAKAAAAGDDADAVRQRERDEASRVAADIAAEEARKQMAAAEEQEREKKVAAAAKAAVKEAGGKV